MMILNKFKDAMLAWVGWFIRREEREFRDHRRRWQWGLYSGVAMLVSGTYLWYDTYFWPVSGGIMALIVITRLLVWMRVRTRARERS